MNRNKKNQTKASVPINEPKNVNTSLRLNDLNDECLVKIFTYLSNKDLVNIVDYNNYFLTAARIIFKMKFCNDFVSITTEFNFNTESESWTLKLLKYFGAEITKLRMQCHEKYRQFDELFENMISANCIESLVELKLEYPDRFTFYGIKKPFENIHTIDFYHGSYSRILSEFDTWFPNVHTLKLQWQEDKNYINEIKIKKYPALQHFTFATNVEWPQMSNKMYKAIIVNNPQLTCVCIEFGLDGDKYAEDFGPADFDGKFLKNALPNLESLHLIFSNGAHAPEQNIHFDKLKNLTLINEYSCGLEGLRITSNNLNNLKVSSCCLGSDCLTFIADNMTVMSIDLLSKQWLNSEVLKRLINILPTLPNLKELQLPSTFSMGISKNDEKVEPLRIIGLMKSCESLNKLVVIAYKTQLQIIADAFHAADDLIQNEWKFEKSSVQIGCYPNDCLVFSKVVPKP